MTETTDVRDRMHIKYCPDDQCTVEYADPGDCCKNLDFLLDAMEERALHRAAARVLDLHMDAVLQHGAGVGQGLVLAAKEVDPYRRQADGSLVRVSDGSPAPQLPED
jgi:hypothetical protein